MTSQQSLSNPCDVTQDDRDAAARLIEAWSGEGVSRGHHRDAREGKADATNLVQAFARHREAAAHLSAPEPSAGAREAALALMTELYQIAGNKPTVFTLESIGPAGTVLMQQYEAIERALAAHPSGRAEGLEEAAKVAEKYQVDLERLIEAGKGEHGKPGYVRDDTWSSWLGQRMTAEAIARAIRALAHEQPAAGEQEGTSNA